VAIAATALTAVGTAAFTTVGAVPAYATSSGRNGRIAFRRYFNEAHTRGAIFTVNPDGTAERQVTHSFGMNETTEPDWSPNGRWIAFYGPTSSDTSRHVALVHPNGTGLHTITSGPGTWGSLSFSPDGRKITASHSPGFGIAQNADVYTMNIDGTDLTNVTNSNGFESAPDWGPASG
jgi:TolB protein